VTHVLCVLLAFSAAVLLSAKQATVVIDWADVRQSIDGFGASSYANQFPDDVIKNADLLFTTSNGVGLSLMRMGLPHNPDTGGRPYKDPEIAQLAQARGATVWASNFYPPAAWKTNGSAMNGGSLLPEYYDDYADLLADEIQQMQSKYGVTVTALSVQNEPDNSPPWGSCTFSGAQFYAFLPILKAVFVLRDLPTKIILGEQTAWVFTRIGTVMNDPVTRAMVDVVAAHRYASPDGWASPYKGVKPVWQTEHSIGTDTAHSISTALTQATEIHNFLVQSEINAWHAWNLGVIMNGKRLYTLGNWSKFVRPGWVRIATTQVTGPLVSAFKHPSSGTFAVVVVNNGPATTLTLSLRGFTTTQVTPWVTSATLNLASQQSLKVTSSAVTVSLAATSVTTFVGAEGLVSPTAPTNLRIIG
jgi:O-glycosyl hydrolase